MNPFVLGAASGMAGQYVYEEIIMPTVRDGSGRGVEGVATSPRTISVRQPITRGASRVIDTGAPAVPAASVPRALPVPRAPMTRGDIGRPIDMGTPPAAPGSTAPLPVDPGTLPPVRRYPGNDPLSILADVFASFFGAHEGTEGEQQYSVVPQLLDEGGGGNLLLIVGVLALAAFGIYYFYFRN